MQTEKYQTVTKIYDGVEVTAENMTEVAEWCGGKLLVGEGDAPYIKVRTHNPLNKRQTQAFVGDHVLYETTRKTFKIYTPTAFAASFESVFRGGFDPMDADTNGLGEDPMEELPQPGPTSGEDGSTTSEEVSPPDVNYRDAITGEFVSKEYADANPDTTVKETDYQPKGEPPTQNLRGDLGG